VSAVEAIINNPPAIEQHPEPTLSERARFLAERRKSIGGSDIGAILGVDQYRSPLDVYNSKTGLVLEADFGNAHTIRGTTTRGYSGERIHRAHRAETQAQEAGDHSP
jgi:predicted phage-related endonuclease